MRALTRVCERSNDSSEILQYESGHAHAYTFHKARHAMITTSSVREGYKTGETVVEAKNELLSCEYALDDARWCRRRDGVRCDTLERLLIGDLLAL